MSLIFVAMVTGVMTLVSIGIFSILPGSVKKLCAYVPIVGFLLNLLASSFILMFTGVAMLVGISNLAASIFFGVYLLLYRQAHGINDAVVVWKGPWKLKIFPFLRIIEARPRLSGLAQFIF